MKQYFQKLAIKVDAMSLRERAIIFAMCTLILIVLVNTLALDGQFARQTQLSQKLKQENAQIAGIQAEIQQKVLLHSVDPDAENQTRLKSLKQQASQMQIALQDTQKGLVSPDKMATLLEDILRKNGRLRVISLKTLPVMSLSEVATIDGKNATDKAASTPVAGAKDKAELNPVVPPIGAAYKHGVEITVQGNYLDMMNYMAELEAMPWQVYWGKAKLSVIEYPQASLTLTLFTLSLDKKWLNL